MNKVSIKKQTVKPTNNSESKSNSELKSIHMTISDENKSIQNLPQDFNEIKWLTGC